MPSKERHSLYLVDTTSHVAGNELDTLENARKLVGILRYRGLEPRIKVWDEAQEKYVIDEVLTDEAKQWADDMHNNNRMGRPSQGRSARLQVAITPEQAVWLEQQRNAQGEKSVSDVVFKLIEEKMR